MKPPLAQCVATWDRTPFGTLHGALLSSNGSPHSENIGWMALPTAVHGAMVPLCFLWPQLRNTARCAGDTPD